jgi:hypothetical protein
MPAYEPRHQLGEPDIQQIKLLLSVSPAQRLRTMLNMQRIVLRTWRKRLKAAHPELNDLELTKLVFERLSQNG